MSQPVRRCSYALSLIRGLSLVVVVALVGVMFSVAPASAVEAERETRPVVAGTRLEFQFGGECTAGAVVQANSWSSLLLPKQRATRYVVTAKHCANRIGEGVFVKNEAERIRGIPAVGEVVWKSPDIDLALVKIYPLQHDSRSCVPSSHGGPHCVPVTTWTPNALGRVLTASLRTRSIYAQPVPGHGDPGIEETFATSGSTTGVQVNWRNLSVQAWPPRFRLPRAGDRAASSNTDFLLGGDSGGPVFNPTTGKLYGIITDQLPVTTQPSTMIYIKLSQFFREQTGYRLVTS